MGRQSQPLAPRITRGLQRNNGSAFLPVSSCCHIGNTQPEWSLKGSSRVFGSFLPEGEGDECSSSGSKCSAAMCFLNIIPPTPAEHTCRVASLCWHPKKATSSHQHWSEALGCDVCTTASSCSLTKRLPRHRHCKAARLCSWELIWYCLGQELPGLARVFSSYQDIYP